MSEFSRIVPKRCDLQSAPLDEFAIWILESIDCFAFNVDGANYRAAFILHGHYHLRACIPERGEITGVARHVADYHGASRTNCGTVQPLRHGKARKSRIAGTTPCYCRDLAGCDVVNPNPPIVSCGANQLGDEAGLGLTRFGAFSDATQFCQLVLSAHHPRSLARRCRLVPHGRPRDSHCPQVIEELAGVNGLVICGPQQKITRTSHVADLGAIHFDRSEVVRGKTSEKFQILLMKRRREVQLITHTRVSAAAKR